MRHLTGAGWSYLQSGGREVQQCMETTICHRVSGDTDRHPVFLGSSRGLCLPPLQSFLGMFCCVLAFEHLRPSADLLKDAEQVILATLSV